MGINNKVKINNQIRSSKNSRLNNPHLKSLKTKPVLQETKGLEKKGRRPQ